MPLTIRIIRPSSCEGEPLLPQAMDMISKVGFSILYDELPKDPAWPYSAGSVKDRSHALNHALLEQDTVAIWAARGGYGASDLLPLIPWNSLKDVPEKCLIGFSDISALHCALFTRLGWRGLHAPMPATTLFNPDHNRSDIDTVFNLLNNKQSKVQLELKNVSATKPKISGVLFGGCFSVLTNLIGTDYFPRSLKGMILFFEDTDENPGRILRQWNQWLQSHVVEGIAGVVLGRFRNCGQDEKKAENDIYHEFSRRSPCAVFSCEQFGHIHPNMPLLMGAKAEINNNVLTYNVPPELFRADPHENT